MPNYDAPCNGRGALPYNRNTSHIPLSCFKGKVRILTKGVEISSDTGDFRTFFFFSGMRGFTKIT